MIRHLDNEKWFFKEYPADARQLADLDKTVWHNAKMPTSIYSSLIDCGQIDNKDFYSNPQKFVWVSNKAWIYRANFQLDKDFLSSGERFYLNLDSLDTVSNIWVNGKLIGKTDNCFVCQKFDVSEFLIEGENSVMIKFEPAVETSKKIMERYTPFKGFLNPYRTYLRKAQFSFGWDFSPALPGCGLYGKIYIQSCKIAKIDNIHIRAIEANEHYADLKISVYLERFRKASLKANLSITGLGFDRKLDLDFSENEKQNSIIIRIERPFLWNPNGCGVQCFYDIDVRLSDESGVLDKTNHKYAIRTIKVNRNKDKYGKSFEFEVNHQPIYIKGANWVPLSIMPNQVSDKKYEQMIKDAADAGLNMLRVWGGGYYEKDIFYELCDKYGILVWQDFMFACGHYPDKDWFYEQVRAEAEYNIKRLRNRACIAVWCGNNECHWLHTNLGLGNGKRMYGRDIFEKLLPECVRELDPDKEYIPTTPFGNSKDYNTADEGTFHNWDVWSGNKPVIDYLINPVPRFVTEFGFQSLPDIETVKAITAKERLSVGDFDIEKHNYQTQGSSRLYQYVFSNFKPTDNLEKFVYLSQLTQARAVKLYAEHLRANNDINRGVMFWQFNEPFPAISWSAIDHFGRKKALYYYSKKFFNPIMPCICLDIIQDGDTMEYGLNGISVVVVNDSSKGLTAQLHCKLISMQGDIIDTFGLPVSVSANTKSIPVQLPKSFVHPESCENCFLNVELMEQDEKIADNIYLYSLDKHIGYPKPDFEWGTKEQDDKTILEVKTKTFLKDFAVFANCDFQPDDNYFDILPNTKKTISFNGLLSNEQIKSLKFYCVNSC